MSPPSPTTEVTRWPAAVSRAAVKRAVDGDRTPGQFLLTGSIRATTELATWAGTGRVVRLAMHPLTEREIAGDIKGEDLVTRLVGGWLDTIPSRVPTLDIDDYVRIAARGSFPELAFAERTGPQRRLWLDSYIDDLVTRDVESIDARRDPARLRRYLTALALNLAGQPSEASLFRDAGINAKTAAAYDRALTNLAVLDIVSAWASNRLKRLTKAGKRYLVDTALAAAAADVNEHEIVRDGDLRGRWFDAFAMMQLRARARRRIAPADDAPPARRGWAPRHRLGGRSRPWSPVRHRAQGGGRTHS
jgi:uncharacterized protein